MLPPRPRARRSSPERPLELAHAPSELALALALLFARELLAPALHEPGVVERLGDLVLAADVLDGAVSAQPGEHNLELLLGGELAVVALGRQLDLLRAAILRAASDAFVAPPGLLGVRAIYVRRVSTREWGPGQGPA
jgi:hypothetical protein